MPPLSLSVVALSSSAGDMECIFFLDRTVFFGNCKSNLVTEPDRSEWFWLLDRSTILLGVVDPDATVFAPAVVHVRESLWLMPILDSLRIQKQNSTVLCMSASCS